MRRVMFSLAVCILAVCVSVKATFVEPTCQSKNCANSEVCRVVETCNAQNVCSHQAVCLPQSQSDLLSGGCISGGEPLLVSKTGRGYDLRTCYTRRNCGDGFYCSAALMDASSRCCRATTGTPSAPKPGSCPAPEKFETFFCVDECRSDSDCIHGSKCCQNSQSCPRLTCKPPAPCSVKTCPTGTMCVETPNYGSACKPPTVRPSMPNNPSQGTDSCQNQRCSPSQVCRLVETCASPNSCTYQAVCLDQRQSELLSGGCISGGGKPLLVSKTGGGYDLRSCYTRNNCGDGFYCSTALQDVSSRCCPAATSNSPPKSGSCPAPSNADAFFCVDECRTDADCFHEYKCCQKSSSCTRRTCRVPQTPDPCSVRTCASGEICVVAPARTAHCLPAPPTLTLQQPPSSGGNTNSNSNNAGPFQTSNGSGRFNTCPSPYRTYRLGECNPNNRCGAARRCPLGNLCCATAFCGNICRLPAVVGGWN